MSPSEPHAVTIVIPTRDRDDRVTAALESVMRSDHPAFEVLVVDQSEGDATQTAVQPVLQDPRVRYSRSATRGLAAALNHGIVAVATELVAITGDDCEVRPDWLGKIVAGFAVDRRTGVVFGSVLPGPHDPAQGFVPGSVRNVPVLVRVIRDKHRLAGTSACMALRRTVWQALSGFDEMLGVGAPFRSGEDADFALRALSSGYYVYETPEAVVVHHGAFRWDERPELIRRNWYGTGAALAKPLKHGNLSILLTLARLAGHWATGRSVIGTSLGEGPFRRPSLTAFARGLLSGVLTPVDHGSGHFRPRFGMLRSARHTGHPEKPTRSQSS